MLALQILSHTPVAIWALLAGLVALGLSQARQRTMSAPRVAAVPLIMIGLSVAGVLTGFAGHAVPLAAWAVGFALTLAAGPALLPRATAEWSADGATAKVAGSWLPLALILGVFALKYAAGVSVALHPALAADTAFAASFGFGYGLFSGAFALRGWQLWSTRRSGPVTGVSAAA